MAAVAAVFVAVVVVVVVAAAVLAVIVADCLVNTDVCYSRALWNLTHMHFSKQPTHGKLAI